MFLGTLRYSKCFAWTLLVLVHLVGKSTSIAQAAQSDDVLVQVSDEDSRPSVGILVNEDAEQITIRDFSSAKTTSYSKSEIAKIARSISLNEAVRLEGLTPVVGWKLKVLADRKPELGKIARVTGQVVYTTLGESDGLKVGQTLSVFRNDGQIVHPDTGEVLGSERAKIADLEVLEVRANLAKAKLKVERNLEITLVVGDEVEQVSNKMIVAVCPVFDEDGTLTNIGAGIAEDLTTTLVQKKVPVVERSLLSRTVSELVTQNSLLFDEESAQKIGKLSGATHVLSGKIVPKGRRGMLYLRLVNVQTGKIQLAVSDSVSLMTAKKIDVANDSLISPMRSPAEVNDDEDKKVVVFNMIGTKTWEDSGVTVKKGETLFISAPDDRIDYRKSRSFHGISTHVGALLARIDGNLIAIGTAKQFTSPGTGTLYFRQNLGRSPNHTVDITITRIRSGK